MKNFGYKPKWQALAAAAVVLVLACHKESPILPFHFVMGTDNYPASNMGRPAKGDTVQDPDFLTTFQRITDKSDGYAGPGIENEYAKTDPENCDGSLLILRGNDGSWFLYNPVTFQMIKNLDPAFHDCNQEPEPRWDQINPKVFYYLCQTELKSYNIDSDVSTSIHDFKKEIPGVGLVTTGTEGDASLDRRFWCFMVDDSLYNLVSVVVYDRTLDSVVGRKDAAGFPDAINWVGMDMSGNHALVGFEALPAVQVYSRDLLTVLILPSGSNAHGDLALTAGGSDVFVYQNTATDYISFADLNTGAETPLVKIPFDVNGDIGLHFSGNCSQTPGWVLVSTYGSQNPPPDNQHSWMDCQLFVVELKANPRIWRLVHTQSYTSKDFNGEKNYFAEAFATINALGTRVYWGSNWRNYTMDYTDTYELTLPGNWTTEMPN
jgi:hypothetical protein